jgi:hypothetical protein
MDRGLERRGSAGLFSSQVACDAAIIREQTNKLLRQRHECIDYRQQRSWDA